MSTERRHACTDSDSQAAARSTKRLHRAGDEPMTPPQRRPPLVVDILLEIAARADVKTLVRVAAASKPLRRDILCPGFHRQLLAVRAAADRWFDPALLRGVSYRREDRETEIASSHVVETPQSSRPRVSIDHGLLTSLEPVTSRDGFLVLRRQASDEQPCAEFCVCDTLTGHVTSLPAMSLRSQRRRCYTPALLIVDGTGRSFELLVANRSLEFRTFSSQSGQWGAVRTVSRTPPQGISSRDANPAVVGRTVHWLIFLDCISKQQHITSLDVDAGTATAMLLPQGCRTGSSGKDVLPVALGGRLSLVVVESLEVSMWMLTTSPASAPAWSQQCVIRTQEIERWAGLDADSFRALLPVGGFGERSGALILQLKNGNLVRLDLGTTEVTTLCRETVRVTHVFLHEIDLASLLQAMKYF